MVPTMDRPPAYVSPGGLTTPHRAGLACYETLCRTSALEGPTTGKWFLYDVTLSQKRKKKKHLGRYGDRYTTQHAVNNYSRLVVCNKNEF